MNDFLAGVWVDLRQKRLVPVAVGLLLALIAIPVFLVKPAKEPEPVADTASASTGGLPSPLVALEGAAAKSRGSDLDQFSSKDPFKAPPGQRVFTESSGSTGSGDSTGGGGSTDGGTTGGGGGGSTGGGGTGGGGGTPGTGAPRATDFAYVADVTLSVNDTVRRRKGLGRLDVLPSQSNPLLIFLGVDSGADNAVFLVDSTLQASGEGNCSPSPSSCGVLTLGAGSEHQFVDEDGDTYGLRIDEIRRVRVSQASASKRPTAATAKRRFSAPVLIDLVSVSTGDENTSSTAKGGR